MIEKNEYSRLIALSTLIFLANFFLFIVFVIDFFFSDLLNSSRTYIFIALYLSAIIYYLIIFTLAGHYIDVLKSKIKKNPSKFYAIMWISIFIISFLVFFIFSDLKTAIALFGTPLVIFILSKIKESFEALKKSKKKKSKK